MSKEPKLMHQSLPYQFHCLGTPVEHQSTLLAHEQPMGRVASPVKSSFEWASYAPSFDQQKNVFRCSGLLTETLWKVDPFVDSVHPVSLDLEALPNHCERTSRHL